MTRTASAPIIGHLATPASRPCSWARSLSECSVHSASSLERVSKVEVAVNPCRPRGDHVIQELRSADYVVDGRAPRALAGRPSSPHRGVCGARGHRLPVDGGGSAGGGRGEGGRGWCPPLPELRQLQTSPHGHGASGVARFQRRGGGRRARRRAPPPCRASPYSATRGVCGGPRPLLRCRRRRRPRAPEHRGFSCLQVHYEQTVSGPCVLLRRRRHRAPPGGRRLLRGAPSRSLARGQGFTLVSFPAQR